MKQPYINKGARGGSFDAEKYERLMDRLEAVEITWQSINTKKSIRIDSERYQT